MNACPPHAYVIETPHGVTVKGTCKKCGAVREWPTTLPEKWGIGIGGDRKATTKGGDVKNG